MLYIPSLTHCSAAGIPTFLTELINSHVLFFLRDEQSRSIANSLGIDLALVLEYRQQVSTVQDLQLRHFPIYSSRLQTIQQKMNDWKPQRISDLWVRPYRDPLAFYAFWFATFIGIMSIFALGASLAQTYASLKALNLQMN